MSRGKTSLTVIGLRLVLIVAVILLLNHILGGFFRSLEYEIRPETAAALRSGLLVTCLIYALLLALPFVPGVEIGVGLLTMFGPAAALHVYLATVLGLTLAFLAGRLIPLRYLAGAALWANMTLTAAHLVRIEALPMSRRLEYLTENAPAPWGGWLIRNRYLAVAALLNLPGNVLIGGGGGIALMAGLSRVFPVPAFVALVAIAVSPVPLAVWFFGASFLGDF